MSANGGNMFVGDLSAGILKGPLKMIVEREVVRGDAQTQNLKRLWK